MCRFWESCRKVGGKFSIVTEIVNDRDVDISRDVARYTVPSCDWNGNEIDGPLNGPLIRRALILTTKTVCVFTTVRPCSCPSGRQGVLRSIVVNFDGFTPT